MELNSTRVSSTNEYTCKPLTIAPKMHVLDLFGFSRMLALFLCKI